MFFKDRYGAIPFGIFVMLANWAPTMTLLFCVTHAALLIIAGVTTWRRTHLRFAASSMFMGAAAFIAIAWQAGLQQTFSDVLQAWLWPFVAWTALGVVVMYLEPLVHREKWEVWKRHMEGMSFGDMLLMRHIPHWQ
jgi:hypothetical protein